MDAHRLAEVRSLAYHRAVADRLRQEPSLLEAARRKVDGWIAARRSEHYARAWRAVLSCPLTEVCAFLVEDTEHARALRQSTPFAGAIGPRERWRIWKEARDAAGE